MPGQGNPVVTPDSERITEAVDTLFSYTRPHVDKCLGELELPAGLLLDDLRDYVTDALSGRIARHPLRLSDFMAGLEKLQRWGRQNVFLHRTALGGDEPMLASLRDATALRERTAAFCQSRTEAGDEQDCFNNSIYVWDAEQPQLCELRHTPDDLLLKWVETRTWLQTISTKINPANGQKAQIAIPRRERSLNFFHLDLRTGESELRIQTLHENAGRSLAQEVQIYRQIVVRMLGFDPFMPVPLEPVIRNLLDSRASTIRRWVVKLANGGWLDGHAAPSPDTEQLRLGEYAGLKLHYDWVSPNASDRRVEVWIFSKTNHLELVSACEAEDGRALLADVRRCAENEETILDPDLRAVAQHTPSLRYVMHRLDLQFSRLGKQEILAHQLAAEDGITTELVFAAFEALKRQNSARFQASYYVRDPHDPHHKDRAIKQADGTLEYESPADIPNTVQFKRAKKILSVATPGNIGARLSARKAARVLWVTTLHGIRTYGSWQRHINPFLNDAGINHYPFDYGYFNLISFFLPSARRRAVARFRDAYSNFCHEHGIKRCSIVAHSFGTYLVAEALETYGLSFDRIVLCGSIIRRDFPWPVYLAQDRVRQILNDCGHRDLWVKLVVWFVSGTGASGAAKFTTADSRLLQHVHPAWKHSDFFYVDNYRTRWIPFLLHRKPLEIEPAARLKK